MSNATPVNVFEATEITNPKRVVIYGCGGAGINQARRFEELVGKSATGYAEIVPMYIDTSDSNSVQVQAAAQRSYRFEGTVGSGGLRKEHVDLIADAVNEILSRLRPGDLNIVVSSLSGGSGSVIAPCLASELLARGLKVIVIGIGSNESEIRVRNSLNAIRSYANIAEETEKPVVMSLHFNSPKTPRYAVDDSIFKVVLRLAVLFSGLNRELDDQDLQNWLAFNRTTKFQPALYTLAFATSEQAADYNNLTDGEIVVTEAILFPEDADTSISFGGFSDCRGFVRKENQQSIELDYPMGFLITDGRLSKTVDVLNQTLQTYEERLAAVRPRNSGLVTNQEGRTKRGLVV